MITNATRDAILAALIETGNIADPVDLFVGVFETLTNNGRFTVLSDLVMPAGAGLATRQPVATWSDPHVKPNGLAMVDSPALEFRPANAGEGTTVQGWYVANDLVAGALVAFGLFPAPVPLPDQTAAVTVVYRLTVDPDGTWDSTVVYNG